MTVIPPALPLAEPDYAVELVVEIMIVPQVIIFPLCSTSISVQLFLQNYLMLLLAITKTNASVCMSCNLIIYR